MTDGPRLTRKGLATRSRIVAAAAGLMFTRGVAGTSTEDVCAAAGVSSSQLYHYFADKRALVRAVVAHQTEQILTPQEPLFARLDTVDGLRAWRDALVDVQHERRCVGGCPLGSLGSELAEIDDGARVDVVDGFARWAAAIRDGLAAMRARGALPVTVDVDELALGILAALQGGLLLTEISRDTVALEAALDTVIAHVAALTTEPEELVGG
ncbi:TetR family transcriptional regulator [Pseudonocardia sp. CNS-139]|nr:TetR family transcriptional regulator [Pseudonocardia sp. CNS-139]